MRDFSQFLQQGEGETLSPQLRARILAAVPDMVPATPPVRSTRPFSRPMLAWGAVASALLLCILLTPLFLKNDQTVRLAATTAASTSSPKAAGSVNGYVTGRVVEETKSSETREAMSTSAPPALAAAPSAPRKADSAAGAPGAPASKSVTVVVPLAPKDRAVADAEYGISKGVAEPQRNMPAAKSVASGGSVSVANGDSEHAAMPSTPPIGASAARRIQADGPDKADSLDNSLKAPAASKPSPTEAAPAGNNVVAANSTSGANPPRPAAQFKGASRYDRVAKKKAAHAVVANKRHEQAEASDILLLVGNVEQSRAALEQTVKGEGGTISNTKDVTYGDSAQAVLLTLDVPTAQLPALLSKLDALGQRKPFRSAVTKGKTQFKTSSAASAQILNMPSNKTTNYVDNSGTPGQSQSGARVPQRARMSPNIASTPSAPANTEPKPSAGFGLSSSNTRITIHLQEKPKR